MARTTAPLFSMDASGTVAGSIVFSRWRGRNYVRRHAIPANPRSDLQTGIRAAFRFLTQDYGLFADPLKAAWTAVGDVTRTTGLNALVAENIRRLREGRVWRYDPGSDAVSVPASPTSLTATPLSGALQLDWTAPSPLTDMWGVAVHMKIGSAVTPSIANLIYVLHSDVIQLVVTGLTPGTTYHFAVVSVGTANAYGATPAVADGVPGA